MQKNLHHLTGIYRPDIDGLRALAIIFVVLYHTFPAVITGGFIGVDIFFVISGFLISKIIFSQLVANQFSFVQFYVRRIKRIFPSLLTVLTFCYVFGWLNLLADEFKQLGKHIFGGATFISNLILWNESDYFDNASETKPLLHLWSLGIEEQFYFIWPILLWLAWKKKIKFLFVVFIVGLASFFFNLYEAFYEPDSFSAFYFPFCRFWELMAGAALAYLDLSKRNFSIALSNQAAFKYVCSKPKIIRVKNALSILGAIFLAWGILEITKNSPYPGYWALLPVLGTVLIIAAGQDASINRLLLSNRVIVWLGLISYPLYLWHWPLLSFARLLQGNEPPAEVRIVAILASIVLAAITYYFIERPLRKNQFNRTKALILLILLAAIGFIGLNTYQRNGLDFRLNEIEYRLPPTLKLLSLKDPNSSALNMPPLRAACPKNSEFLNEKAPIDCLLSTKPKKPTLYIWGDSYAAHLTIGYEERFGGQYDFARMFHNACPPIMNLELANRKNCTAVNNKIFEQILSERPEKVIIAANWTDYDWAKIEGTISNLHKSGYRNIDLVGPAPVWNDGLYKQLYLKFLSDKDPNIPYRMKFGLNKDFLAIDLALEGLAKKLNVRYISIAKILCNHEGCITRFGETSDTLESIDGGHFTKQTSRYVISQFPGM